MTIGPALRALRESAGLTQTEVGERIKPTPITKQRVGKIEASDDLHFLTVLAYLAAVGHKIQIIKQGELADGFNISMRNRSSE